MNNINVRAATQADTDHIKQLALDNHMFEPDEMGDFDEMLQGFFAGTLDGHQWIVADRGDTIAAAAYFAPEPFSDRMWNLYFIATAPDATAPEQARRSSNTSNSNCGRPASRWHGHSSSTPRASVTTTKRDASMSLEDSSKRPAYATSTDQATTR